VIAVVINTSVSMLWSAQVHKNSTAGEPLKAEAS